MNALLLEQRLLLQTAMVDTHLRHRLVLLQSLQLLWNDHHLLQLLGWLLVLWHHHLLRLLRHLLQRNWRACDKVHLILHDGVLACWHHDDLLRDLSWRHLDGDRKFQILSIEPYDL